MSACRCRRKRTVEKQTQLQRKEAFDLVRIVGIKCYSKERLYRECHEGRQKTLNEGLSRITNVITLNRQTWRVLDYVWMTEPSTQIKVLK